MKRLLLILILTLSFQSWTIAEDIKDFQIEGLGIGESLLIKYSRNEIENFRKASYYNDDEYTTIESLKLPDESKYDYISYSYKTKDDKYIIVGLIADIDSIKSFNNNIDKCYPLKEQIVNDLKSVFLNSDQQDNGKRPHPIDKSGKSKVSTYAFYPKNGGFVSVSCYDWSDEIGYADSLRVGFTSNVFNNWLNNKAYN